MYFVNIALSMWNTDLGITVKQTETEVRFSKLILSSWHGRDIENMRKNNQLGLFEKK